jgi:hypothetical protein
MSGFVHKVYLSIFVAIGFFTLVFLIYWGYSYYSTPLEERPFHQDHVLLKPSGPIGHGLGILGTLLILIGVFSYIGRKKNKFLPRVGALKYWLEFHIFLCSIGPLLILFHTAFKFGGIVSISFWSMVAVVLSGVIGRFIYIQIPRTIQGREMSLTEIQEMKDKMNRELKDKYQLQESTYQLLMAATSTGGELALPGVEIAREQSGYQQERKRIKAAVKEIIQQSGLSGKDKLGVMKLFRYEMKINARIRRLQFMQTLFRHWHVAHLPFALIMLVIMVIHVAITITFGYRWIF